MKIKVEDIYPNPFKSQIVGGKLNRKKVERLKESIEQSDFWDNLLVRPHPKEAGKYELAYGNHRLQAVSELWGEDTEVDLPVRDLSNEDMLRIMANENVESEESRTQYQIDTVLAVKKFLEDNNLVVHPVDSKWGGKRTDEASSREISDFLGTRNWSKSKVADLLKMHEALSPEITERLTSNPERVSKGQGLSKTAGIAIADLKGDSKKYQKALADKVEEKSLNKVATQEVVKVLNDDSYSDEVKSKVIESLGDLSVESMVQAKAKETVTELADDIYVEEWHKKNPPRKPVPEIWEHLHKFDLEIKRAIPKVRELGKFRMELKNLTGVNLLYHLKELRKTIDNLFKGEYNDDKEETWKTSGKEQDTENLELVC